MNFYSICKQLSEFTNTINVVPTNKLHDIYKEIKIQNFLDINFISNYSNSGAGYYQKWTPVSKTYNNISTKYISSISFSFNGSFDDTVLVYINNFEYSKTWLGCGRDNLYDSGNVTLNSSNLLKVKEVTNSLTVRFGAQDLCGGSITISGSLNLRITFI